MSGSIVRQHSLPLTRLLATSSVIDTFAGKVPTLTVPTGEAVLDLTDLPGSVGSEVLPNLLLLPFGSDAADETFDLRVWGWRPLGALWVPIFLAELACTLGATTGVAGAEIVASDFLCDTLVVTTGTDVTVLSPTGDLVAYALVPTRGCPRLEVQFDIGTAAGANTLYALV